MKQLFSFLLLALVSFRLAIAINPPDEGMWIPLWIEKYNYAEMKRLGCKLTADQLYSVANPSVKDAVVGLGNEQTGGTSFFCTGEVISSQGLVLTNHHCGFEAVQSQSSVEHDYLTDGFWAYSKDQELPIEGMTMSFLIRIEDVTAKVLANVNDDTDDAARESEVRKAIKKIEKEASEKGKFDVAVKPFFEGNEYYLYVYQTYKDIRLVGAPPSAIGKFGGDTDNWMWPRHTGDFSMFRIYCAPDGTPATYSKNNVPISPKKYFPISLKGVKKGDFSMIFGFPGTTNRYLTSYGVKLALDESNPDVVKIRDMKLSIMKSYMDKDDKTRIQYASKYAQTANYWKYFIGQSKGLKRWDVYNRRLKLENDFKTWVAADPSRQKKFGNALNDIATGYDKQKQTNKQLNYLNEAVFQGPEFIYFSFGAFQLYSKLKLQNDAQKAEKAKFNEDIKTLADAFKEEVKNFFKDYNKNVDRDLFAGLMQMYFNDIPKESHPSCFSALNNKKIKGDFKAWANDIFARSIFVDEAKLNAFLDKPSFDILTKDPGFAITLSMVDKIRSVYGDMSSASEQIDKGSRLFIAGLRLMLPEKIFSPDANSTMRMTYGTVQDYYPVDAVHYDFITTLKGVMEKEDPKNDEFIVPQKLKDLYNAKDFGQYAENGSIVTCFISNNDITGGNSGSPVINGNGELIGAAFDGNWESMSGDIQYESSVQRTISVDIRYVLFIIDKYAGAKNLIEEMTLVK